ncbi:hypothetical protein [Streptomyces anulatus]|uniref:hypothetical protein n=1 Tax=Streptomyces anulatus TaxID=1892 RepID=UPI0033CE2F4C
MDVIQGNRGVPAEEQLVVIGLRAVDVAVPDLDESMDIRAHETDHGRHARSLTSRCRYGGTVHSARPANSALDLPDTP